MDIGYSQISESSCESFPNDVQKLYRAGMNLQSNIRICQFLDTNRIHKIYPLFPLLWESITLVDTS